MSWLNRLKGRVRRHEPLRRHTSFKIGGDARFFIEPRDPADLKLLLTLLKRYKIPFFIIGAGSNLLAPDGGLDAAVIRLSAPAFTAVSTDGSRMRAGAGIMLRKLLSRARESGLSGLEFLVGIPGTLGGALVMNAGQGRGGRSLRDVCESVQVMDRSGRLRTLSDKGIPFGYRQSGLSHYIVMGATLKLAPASRRAIDARCAKYRAHRANQDYSFPSAGCVFRNPPHHAAGRLIDQCGMKGMRAGGAQVSAIHANFIVNTGRATAADVRALMTKIQRAVKRSHGISLKPELELWK